MKRYEIRATWTHVLKNECENDCFEVLAKDENHAHRQVSEIIEKHGFNHNEYTTDADESVQDLNLETEYEEVEQQ